MDSAIKTLIEAHEYCLALEQLLLRANGNEREALHSALMNAYDELEVKSYAVAGLGFAGRPQFGPASS